MGTAVLQYRFNFTLLSLLGHADGSVTFATEILGIEYPYLYKRQLQHLPAHPRTADAVYVSDDRRTLLLNEREWRRGCVLDPCARGA